MTPVADATVVVELTPPGRAAVAVVLVAGRDALRVVGNCFIPRTPKPIGNIPIGRIVLGRWGNENGEELILCRRDDEQIEIHCHGGSAAVAAVFNRLVKERCQPVSWQEWLSLSSANRVPAAAQIALAEAMTERTAAILLDQLNGALAQHVREILRSLSDADWPAAANQIDELLNRQELGLHLTQPWRVVVCGAPNVGKSSLINALAGYERAIVSPTPGTTRDVVTATTAIDGWPVHLSDTAGLRETQDELESAGIALATSTVANADVVLVVHDASKNRHSEPLSASHGHTIHVVNKVDLIPENERHQLLQTFTVSPPPSGVPQLVSARTGEGISDLIAAVSRNLVPYSLPTGAAVPFTAEQVDALIAARKATGSYNAAAATASLQALLT